MEFETWGGDFGWVSETIGVGIIAVDGWGEGIGRWELGVLAVFVHEDYTSVVEESYECIFGSWDPFYLLHWGGINGALRISLRSIRGATCLLRRMYFWEKHSNQIISPVENPMITSM